MNVRHRPRPFVSGTGASVKGVEASGIGAETGSGACSSVGTSDCGSPARNDLKHGHDQRDHQRDDDDHPYADRLVNAELDGVFERMATAEPDELEKLMERQVSLEEAIDAAGGYAVDHKIDAALHGLGFTDADFELPVKGLSGGQKARLGLARLLRGRAPGVDLHHDVPVEPGLGEVLEELAKQIEKETTLRGKVKSAMTYPIAVIALAIALVNVLLIFVIPVFASMFKDFGAKLPAPTQFLIDLSNFMKAWWWAIGLSAYGIYWGGGKFVATPKGRRTKDQFLVKAPIFGNLIHKIALSRFCRTYATLIRSGVPILRTLEKIGRAHV